MNAFFFSSVSMNIIYVSGIVLGVEDVKMSRIEFLMFNYHPLSKAGCISQCSPGK